ncbi:Di-copper centre-containing protein [Cadophora sp. DSE1049]|nr:Di-copper centre-containing protein [Cadophora sp. DSE1049]
MRLSSILSAALLVLAKVADAAPTTEQLTDLFSASSVQARTTTLVRKEWRNLTKAERLSYIKAFKCLQSKPARFKNLYPGSRTRYDDYQALHISMTEKIHFTGIFLPWHRQYVALFEQDLRNTCGYSGAQPYWDWSKDAGSLDAWAKSPLFDPVYGFGGNGAYIEDITGLPVTAALEIPGRTGGGCVTTGPWANLVVPMGPGNNLSYNPHCLRRDFSPTLAKLTLNSSVLSWVQQANAYALYDRRVQSMELSIAGIATHGGGHFSVGGAVGEMSEMYSSPGDPIFWMHHGMLDNMWNQWQRLNWSVRKAEIAGPDTMWAYPWNYFGDIPYKNITINTPLSFGPLGSTVNISQVMDISCAPLGPYRYA